MDKAGIIKSTTLQEQTQPHLKPLLKMFSKPLQLSIPLILSIKRLVVTFLMIIILLTFQ